MQKHHAESDKQADLQDLAPLKKIHERHLRLDKRKGTVASRVSDATAFLIFLQDSLGHDFNKRAEIIAQLNTAAKLLSDLSQLVADYENTASVLLEPQQQQ